MADMMFMYILFMCALIPAGIFGVLFVVMCMWTNALTQLKAKIGGKPLIYAARRDRRLDLHCGTYIGGIAYSKKYKAIYPINPAGVYNDTKSGRPVLWVNAEVAATATEDVLRCMQALKDKGFETIEEAQGADKLWGVCDKCGYEGPCIPEFIEEQTAEGKGTGQYKFNRLKCPMEEEVKDGEDTGEAVAPAQRDNQEVNAPASPANDV